MNKPRSISLFIIFVFLVLGGASCAQNPGTYPSAWIDYPQDGDVFLVGAPITVISHVFAKGGVAEVVLSVNGEAYRRDATVEAGQEFTVIQQDFIPSEAGIYILQVQTYDLQGQAGNPASISITVKGDVPTQVPTLVASPTTPPTEEIFVLTATPVPTNTFPPPTSPPPTSPPPTSPPPTSPPPTSPPPTDPPPADTTPPPVPSPSSPAHEAVVACASTQTLVWTAVTDPSGILAYFVKLEKLAGGNWESANNYQASGAQVNVSIECGFHYRWRVLAKDNAGNLSDWSGFAEFAVGGVD